MRQANTERASPADVITAAIIERLEAGVRPWVRPWACRGGPLRTTGQPYRGINHLYLGLLADLRGYASPYWLTFSQAQADGGQVRRGERGSIAVFYTSYQKTGDPRVDREAPPETRRVLKSYWVFSADQCDGLPGKYFPAPLEPASPEAADARSSDIGAFFDAIPAIVEHGGDHAYYDISTDRIRLPQPGQFVSEDYYFTTRAHETLHWSGAAHRLDRDFQSRFGKEARAAEELVACIGQAKLGAELGLPDGHLDDHASYVASWLKVLRGDSRAIMTAAARADEACDYLLRLGGRRHDAATGAEEADAETLRYAA